MAIVVLAIFLTPLPAHAQKFGIVAVVNGEAITNYALHDRVTLMVRTAGLQNSETVRGRLSGQALQMLINEMLQRQDAKKQGIEVTDQDMARATNELEKKNNLKPGQFRGFVSKAGINPDSLFDQIRTQILWKKLLVRKIQPRIAISDFEVEDAMAHHGGSENSKTRNEVYLSEIVLPIPKGQEEETLQVAQQLESEINAGKDFSKIAQQFSSGSNAENGGVIGWVNEDQLRSALRQHVKNAPANTLLPPIHTEDGYHILRIGDRRSQEIARNSSEPTKESMKSFLLSQKLDLETKRYMKDLHDKSFIEIRQ